MRHLYAALIGIVACGSLEAASPFPKDVRALVKRIENCDRLAREKPADLNTQGAKFGCARLKMDEKRARAKFRKDKRVLHELDRADGEGS